MAAKKRHYESSREREVKGGEKGDRKLHRMAVKRHEMKGAYEGMADRRHQEMKDAGILHEDRHQVANMPQEVRYHAWNKPAYGSLDSGMDDTISGINRQMEKDESQGRKFMRAHKY